MTHLLVALSSHGFGHAAQAAAVVNAWRRRQPQLRLTLRTLLPADLLARRFEGEFELAPCHTDVGMLMSSALDADLAATAAAYAQFHTEWDRRVHDEANALARLAPDLVLADVPYLPLVAAATIPIPAVAMCSLNWADIYAHYFLGTRPEAPDIHAQILDAYQRADCFLQLEPSMPMANLSRRIAIGPVAHVGINRRATLIAALGLSPTTRLAAISLGGIDMRLPVEHWPSLTNVHWLVPASWKVAHRAFTAMESLDMLITDMLSSVDVLIGKPGYGTFTEAACHGTRVLYVRRPDWPEDPCLVDWLTRHGNALEISRQQLELGDLTVPLRKLLEQPQRPPVIPAGIDHAVNRLMSQWSGSTATRYSKREFKLSDRAPKS